MRMFKEQTSLLSVFDQPYLLTELIEAQHEDNPTAVCEVCEDLLYTLISIFVCVQLVCDCSSVVLKSS